MRLEHRPEYQACWPPPRFPSGICYCAFLFVEFGRSPALSSSPMATSLSIVSISGASHLKADILSMTKFNSFGETSRAAFPRKSNKLGYNRNFVLRAENSDGGRGSGGDFIAGFLLGGAIFGTLSYVFAPQIRQSLLNEDEYGFRRAKRPIYYDDEGLEKTRQTLNAKLSQLNAAIDNVSSRLRGGSNVSSVPVETDPEVEATM